MLKGFIAFVARGNVVGLAVAVVVDTAFTAVVNSRVKDLITPFIAAIVFILDAQDATRCKYCTTIFNAASRS